MKIFSVLFPNVPLNIINAGISGNNSTDGLNRLERDVIAYKPDLTVVCFGLNDNWKGADGIEASKEAAKEAAPLPSNVDPELVAKILANPEMAALLTSLAKSILSKKDRRTGPYAKSIVIPIPFERGIQCSFYHLPK